LPHRLEHPVSPALSIEDDQRLFDQLRQDVEQCAPLRLARAAHRFRSFERETSRENGKTPEEHALLVVQELVAPVDQRTQCLLARERGLVVASQQAEPVVEARRDVFDGKRPRSRGGKLDRKRNAVQLVTSTSAIAFCSVTRNVDCAAARSMNSCTTSTGERCRVIPRQT
jgi:hypothetical protein